MCLHAPPDRRGDWLSVFDVTDFDLRKKKLRGPRTGTTRARVTLKTSSHPQYLPTAKQPTQYFSNTDNPTTYHGGHV